MTKRSYYTSSSLVGICFEGKINKDIKSRTEEINFIQQQKLIHFIPNHLTNPDFPAHFHLTPIYPLNFD